MAPLAPVVSPLAPVTAPLERALSPLAPALTPLADALAPPASGPVTDRPTRPAAPVPVPAQPFSATPVSPPSLPSATTPQPAPIFGSPPGDRRGPAAGTAVPHASGHTPASPADVESPFFLTAPGLDGAPQPTLGTRDASSPVPGNSPPAPIPAPPGGATATGGSGIAFSTLFALLVALAAFSAQQLLRRLHLPSAPWRPASFVAVIERPG